MGTQFDVEYVLFFFSKKQLRIRCIFSVQRDFTNIRETDTKTPRVTQSIFPRAFEPTTVIAVESGVGALTTTPCAFLIVTFITAAPNNILDPGDVQGTQRYNYQHLVLN